jgi:hypothetical protein
MIYFLDNDVILKLTAYGIMNEALDCLKIERSNIRVLGSARFVFDKDKSIQKQYSIETRESAIDFVINCSTISSKDSDEYRLLEKEIKNDIDPGEASLIAATFQELGSFLATGDKRCLKALSRQG